VSDEDRVFYLLYLDKHGHANTENVVWLELSLHRRIAMQIFVLG
jgi:hypothetical protein